MARIQESTPFPPNVKFTWAPPTPGDACGIPVEFDASKEFQQPGKTVVLVAVPGAFTPTCQERHVKSYIDNLDKLKAAGVSKVVFIASNDAWVMSAWGKANGIDHTDIVFMSDKDLAFSKSIGWLNGERTKRYAIIVKDGVVIYAGLDDKPGSIEKSGAEAVLAKL